MRARTSSAAAEEDVRAEDKGEPEEKSEAEWSVPDWDEEIVEEEQFEVESEDEPSDEASSAFGVKGSEAKGEPLEVDQKDPYETECMACHQDVVAVIFAKQEPFWRCQHCSGAVCKECYQVGLVRGLHLLGFECKGCRKMSCAGCIENALSSMRPRQLVARRAGPS